MIFLVTAGGFVESGLFCFVFRCSFLFCFTIFRVALLLCIGERYRILNLHCSIIIRVSAINLYGLENVYNYSYQGSGKTLLTRAVAKTLEEDKSLLTHM